jgi:hypothetical protein
MTTETQHPHPHHPHAISAPSAIGVAVIVVLCIGFVTTLAIVLVRAVTPESHEAHIEGTIGDFPSRIQAREEARRRVGVLLIKEPADVTTTPPGETEDFATFKFGDSEMSLHLMPIQLQSGRWGMKWTADLRGTSAKNQEVIDAWRAASGGAESPLNSDAGKREN